MPPPIHAAIKPISSVTGTNVHNFYVKINSQKKKNKK